MKEGKQTTEFKAMIGGVGVIVACLAAVLPIILKSVPEGSPWAVAIGCLLAVVTTISSSKVIQTYISGRTAVKVKEIESKDPFISGGKP